MSDDVLLHLQASLVRFCMDFIDEIDGLGFSGYSFVNLDGHAQLTKLPETDLIVMEGFSLVDQEKTLSVICLFGVSTMNDPGLYRHIRVLSMLFDKLKTMQEIPIYHATQNVVIGWMKATSGTQALPITKADVRSIQLIGVELAASLTA